MDVERVESTPEEETVRGDMQMDKRVTVLLDNSQFYLLMIDGNVVCWNCCGAKSGNFLREVRKLKRIYKPVLLILIEPRTSGREVDEVYQN